MGAGRRPDRKRRGGGRRRRRPASARSISDPASRRRPRPAPPTSRARPGYSRGRRRSPPARGSIAADGGSSGKRPARRRGPRSPAWRPGCGAEALASARGTGRPGPATSPGPVVPGADGSMANLLECSDAIRPSWGRTPPGHAWLSDSRCRTPARPAPLRWADAGPAPSCSSRRRRSCGDPRRRSPTSRPRRPRNTPGLPGGSSASS